MRQTFIRRLFQLCSFAAFQLFASAATITYPGGTRVVMGTNASVAGINVGSVAGNPITLANGDLWYNSTTNKLMARINGSSVDLGAGGGGGSAAWGDITGTLSDQTDLQSALTGRQPLDSDLTAIAALTTTTYGRSLLTLADAAAGRSSLGLGNVENTALSSWAGSSNITTVGTLANPAMSGTATAVNLTLSGILDTGATGSVLTENLQVRSALDDWTATLNADALTANRVLTIADAAGTIATQEWVTGAFVSQTDTRASNTFLAGPVDASTQGAEFRRIAADDLSPDNYGSASATKLLHGNMTWSAVSLTADVTGTLPVANGGTGIASATAYAILAGGTTSTGALQPLASLGTSGQVLTSNGAGALPTWQTSSASPGGSTTQLQRNNAGAFGGISGATSDGTNVTYGSGNLLATSPKITTQLCDANGNPWLLQTATASAVYGARLTNAATGGTVTFAAQAPTQAAAGIVGTPLTISASAATAGSSTAGAVAGGALTLTAGNAARLTSGTANGGALTITSGDQIGGAISGAVAISSATTTGQSGTVTVGSGNSADVSGSVTISVGDTTGNNAGPGTLTIKGGRHNFSGGGVQPGGTLAITTQGGGNSTGGTGANGGPQTLTLGAGGSSSAAGGTGGIGGAWTLTGGAGGAATGTSGTVTGGAGSPVSITSGAGGASTSASGTRVGGNSGTLTIGTGNGGNGSTTNGSSAALTLATGTAGAGAGAAGSVGSVVLSPGGTAGLTVSATSGIVVPKTVTGSGTTGNQTIDKASGAVNFAAGASSLTVTNNKVDTSSIIICTVATNDSTMKSVAVVAGSGSFVIYPNAAPTAETRVNFLITN